MSEKGMKPWEEGLRSIAEMASPQNYTEIQRFLGATGFFQHFIKNYADIARPLKDLLEGEANKWKAQPVDLTPEAVEAFNFLKAKCVTAPVLAFADFEKPFLLETDPSSCGLGAVLSQKQDDDKYHLVAYASRELKGGEKKYHSSKLEFLALIDTRELVVKNVLVIVDHFTRYVQAYVTRNQTAGTTARVLYNEYFSVFGFPKRLMSDQGTGFTSKVIAAMCSLLGIEKIRTTPYHPQSNGSAERVHQMLR